MACQHVRDIYCNTIEWCEGGKDRRRGGREVRHGFIYLLNFVYIAKGNTTENVAMLNVRWVFGFRLWVHLGDGFQRHKTVAETQAPRHPGTQQSTHPAIQSSSQVAGLRVLCVCYACQAVYACGEPGVGVGRVRVSVWGWAEMDGWAFRSGLSNDISILISLGVIVKCLLVEGDGRWAMGDGRRRHVVAR